jgi:hypothetical protein
VFPIEVRVATEETVARELLFDGALGQTDVSLRGDATADVGNVHGLDGMVLTLVRKVE